MLSFTRQERQVILFLIAVALIGLGINFGLKINSRVERVVSCDVDIAKINLNKASLEALVESRCLSSKLAQRVIAYRNNHGLFEEIEELKEIKGIGEYRLKKIKEVFFVQ